MRASHYGVPARDPRVPRGIPSKTRGDTEVPRQRLAGTPGYPAKDSRAPRGRQGTSQTAGNPRGKGAGFSRGNFGTGYPAGNGRNNGELAGRRDQSPSSRSLSFLLPPSPTPPPTPGMRRRQAEEAYVHEAEEMIRKYGRRIVRSKWNSLVWSVDY